MRALVAVLLASFSLPAGAWALGELAPPAVRSMLADGGSLAATIAEPDDDIPGIAIAPSPVVDSLNDTYPTWDFDDVRSVRLEYNQRLTASITGAPNTDFDLWLWKPGSVSVGDPSPQSKVVASSQTRGTSTESLWFPSSSAGTYYLDVFADPESTPNRGAYTLTWSVDELAAPSVTLSADPTKTGYNGSAELSGVARLAGVPLGGARIQLQRRPAGSSGSWTTINMDTTANPDVPRTVTTSGGLFAYRVAGITSKTEYRAVVWPASSYGWAASTPVAVTPKPYLSRPYAPKTARRNRSFTVYGYLKPHHTSGAKHVKITAYHGNGGTWRFARSYDHKSYTMYKTTIILPETGRWKLVATAPSDAGHQAAASSATYVTVR